MIVLDHVRMRSPVLNLKTRPNYFEKLTSAADVLWFFTVLFILKIYISTYITENIGVKTRFKKNKQKKKPLKLRRKK